MEAVPRLPMMNVALKQSTEATSFSALKNFIAERYHEQPEAYANEVNAFEQLRNTAVRPNIDVNGCSILKRYYCQLHSLQSRLPSLADTQMFKFSYRLIFSDVVTHASNIRFEMAVTLYNYGALHTQLGSSDARTTQDGMKLSCTHFQCAAWAFTYLREHYSAITILTSDMLPELLHFYSKLCFAQAQECILEKSLSDNRKAAIVAKVTAQIISYYNAAMASLLSSGTSSGGTGGNGTATYDDTCIKNIIGSKKYKEWKRYITFKIYYLNSILLLYQGQQAEEQQKMGERVTLYQAAFDKLEEAKQEAKGITQNAEQIQEALIFVMDVVEAKRKAAKNENEFIYHEAIPELSTLTAVEGANLVNGIGFNVNDPEAIGKDIFQRLVPMKAHEASSMYSEEKANLLRKVGQKIEANDQELNRFMTNVNIEFLNFDAQQPVRLPQSLVDRCAELHAKPNAIPDLVKAMSNLADICTDVETMLNEIKELLSEEERQEKGYQQKMGVRPTTHFSELIREYQKYQEAHNKAGESNNALRNAAGSHIHNLKALAQPIKDIQAAIPVCRMQMDYTLKQKIQLIIGKINEMRQQRSVLFENLRDACNNDDITAQLITWGDKKIENLFDQELQKHEKTVLIIDQNLAAQNNILEALTESYAKCADLRKVFIQTKQEQEFFLSSLAASYDVYDDLLLKCSKGLEFYKKLQGNIQKLLVKIRGARDVQDEERQQRLMTKNMGNKNTENLNTTNNIVNNNNNNNSNNNSNSTSTSTSTSSSSFKNPAPKLKDYLKGGTIPTSNIGSNVINNQNNVMENSTDYNNLPNIRPNPLGSENNVSSSCGMTNTTSKLYTIQQQQQQHPQQFYQIDDPPPPYAPPTSNYVHNMYNPYNAPIENISQPNFTGNEAYTNSMYQQQQLNLQYHSQPQMHQNISTIATTNYNTNVTTTIAPSIYQQQSDASIMNYQSQPQQQQQSLQNNYSQNSYGPQTAHPQSVYTNASFPNEMISSTSQNNYYMQQQQQQQQPQPQDPNTYMYQQNQPQIYQDSQVNYHQTATASVAVAPSPAPSPLQYDQTNNSQLWNSQQQPHQLNQQMANLNIQEQYNGATSQSYQNLNYANQLAQQQQSSQQINQNPSILSNNGIQPQYIEQSTATTYTTTSQPNYQITANNQYVTGYDQNVSIHHSNGSGLSLNIQTGDQSQQPQQTGLNTPAYSGTSHPGYSFNSQTGEYQYASGYQNENNQIASNLYTQYTNAGNSSNINTTESTNIGFSGQSYVNQYSGHIESNQSDYSNHSSYNQFNSGHAVVDNNTNIAYNINAVNYQPNSQLQQPQQQQQPQEPQLPPQPQQQLQNQQQIHSPQQHQQQQQQTISNTNNASSIQSNGISSTPKKSSNIDLLSGLDFTLPEIVPAPLLPSKMANSSESETTPAVNKQSTVSTIQQHTKDTKKITKEMINPTSNIPDKLSEIIVQPSIPPTKYDFHSLNDDQNTNIGKDNDNNSINWDLKSLQLSSNDDNLNLSGLSSTLSTNNNKLLSSTIENEMIMSKFKEKDQDQDNTIWKWFHKEVERLEKCMETINIKTLNCTTPLDSKWKELQDLLVKDEGKRTTTIAKLFPDKNRLPDSIPYDHARVMLPKTTDDFINAAYVKLYVDKQMEIGARCPSFILAQTPIANTVIDFWCMIWSEKIKTIVCLHSPTEMLDPFFPRELNKECMYDDYSVTILKQFDLSHCIEYQIVITLQGCDMILNSSIIQIKSWPKNSITNILGITQNIILAYQQREANDRGNKNNGTNIQILLNCISGSERSGLIALAIAAKIATSTKPPSIIKPIDVWYRICSQRKGALRDISQLELSMQIVLSNAHDILNKNGIMTSYQMKKAQETAAAEKNEINDPFNDLDPLWKLK